MSSSTSCGLSDIKGVVYHRCKLFIVLFV